MTASNAARAAPACAVGDPHEVAMLGGSLVSNTANLLAEQDDPSWEIVFQMLADEDAKARCEFFLTLLASADGAKVEAPLESCARIIGYEIYATISVKDGALEWGRA